MAQLKQKRTIQTSILLLILMLAAGLRLWRLGSLPPGLYHDEAYNGLDALSLTQGESFPQFYEGWELYAQDAHENNPPQESRWPIFFEGNYGREPLHIYLMALSVRLFGNSPLAIRIVPALAGILAVWTTYLAARALQKRSDPEEQSVVLPESILLDPAITAALMAAILFPAILFSRFGLRVMLFVPLETLAVTFFWFGINRGQAGGKKSRIPLWAYFLAAGLFLGLGLYSYAIARLFPLVFILFILYWFWRDGQARRRFWRSLLLMAGSALLVAAPLLIFFARYPYFFIFRIQYVANKGLGTVADKPWQTWLLNVVRVIRGLLWQGEMHLRHNLPGRPYLDPIQAFFMLAGLTATIRQRRQLQNVFLWIWLLVMLLPSILSGDAPHFGRLIGAAPVLAIFIGIGFAWFGRRAIARVGGPYRVFIRLGLGLLLLLSIIFAVRDYFYRYASHPQLPNAFYEADWLMGQFAASQAAETRLYMAPNQEEMATIYFALDDPRRLTSFAGLPGLLPLGNPGQPSLYLIRPDIPGYRQEMLSELEAYFPDYEVGDNEHGYIPFSVPAGAQRVKLPEESATALDTDLVFPFEDKIRLLAWSLEYEDDLATVTLVWQALDDMTLDYTAYVHLLDESGQVSAQLDRQPAGYPTSDWQAGEIVVDHYQVQLPPEFEAGNYTLQTGFYYLPSLERLGVPAVLMELSLP